MASSAHPLHDGYFLTGSCQSKEYDHYSLPPPHHCKPHFSVSVSFLTCVVARSNLSVVVVANFVEFRQILCVVAG